MEIGKKLKEARIASGLTQEQVADKINVSRQTISNWENEKSYPDIIDRIDMSNLYSIISYGNFVEYPVCITPWNM